MYLRTEKAGMQLYDETVSEEKIGDQETSDKTKKPEPSTGNKTMTLEAGTFECEQVPSLANKDRSGTPWIVLKDTKVGASLAAWEQLIDYGIWGARFYTTPDCTEEFKIEKWRPVPREVQGGKSPSEKMPGRRRPGRKGKQ